MGLEANVRTIADLNPLFPTETDPVVQGDNHIRSIKNAIKKTFPNINAVVNVTPAQLNLLTGITVAAADINRVGGLTAPIQNQITSINNALTTYALKVRAIATGEGLAGGGNLTSNRSLTLSGQALRLHGMGGNGFTARLSTGEFIARTRPAPTTLSTSWHRQTRGVTRQRSSTTVTTPGLPLTCPM